jgi:threonine synthase
MNSCSAILCSRCETKFEPGQDLNLCHCGGPLLVRYDLKMLRERWRPGDVEIGPETMWRYSPVLPAPAQEAVTLKEGWTPLVPTPHLGRHLGAQDLWIKDESRNPTGSFKARGLSCAVTMARKLGLQKVAIPSAGNAAGALAAYAAAAGLEAHIYMPRDVPIANFLECKTYGADVTLVDGLINDCGRIVAEQAKLNGWFDMSTLKEPYRIEGKKTMGFEIAEQFGWALPDAILYPCGGGVGLIGIWKAFAELEELGWVGPRRPRMIAVQAAGCQPIVRAFERGLPSIDLWPDPYTVAAGLRVPKPLGDELTLRALRESGGTAIAVSDEEMMDAALLLAKSEGMFSAPEGGACVAAARLLIARGFLQPDQRILILNTGSGLKYVEAFSARFSRQAFSEQDKLGGLITPR